MVSLPDTSRPAGRRPWLADFGWAGGRLLIRKTGIRHAPVDRGDVYLLRVPYQRLFRRGAGSAGVDDPAAEGGGGGDVRIYRGGAEERGPDQAGDLGGLESFPRRT